jgi:hypothetical protein
METEVKSLLPYKVNQIVRTNGEASGTCARGIYVRITSVEQVSALPTGSGFTAIELYRNNPDGTRVRIPDISYSCELAKTGTAVFGLLHHTALDLVDPVTIAKLKCKGLA